VTEQTMDGALGSPPGLSVAEVRKALAMLRRRWDAVSSGGPAELFAALDLGARQLPAEQFALRFILGQHSKRPLD
jgi:hypothetical protein